MTRSNSQLFILVFLGILTAFGPFVTDMYLPTLPAMTDYFHTTSSQVQLGLTASMIGLAVGQLFFGPLSDKYGRRLPLIVAMCLFLLATLGCLYSRTIMQFVGWRVVQGIAGAGGIVISRSIAADKYSGRELAKMLAIIGAINGVAPVAAPVAGGGMAESVGWHGIFWVLQGGVLGILLLLGSLHLRSPCRLYVARMHVGQMCIRVFLPSFTTVGMYVISFSLVLPRGCCLPILLPLLLLCRSIMLFAFDVQHLFWS